MHIKTLKVRFNFQSAIHSVADPKITGALRSTNTLPLKNAGNTALGLAVASNKPVIVHKLLQSGSSPSSASGPQQIPLLYSACASGHADIAAHLLQAGADPNTSSKEGLSSTFISAAMAGVKLKIPGREEEAEGAMKCLEHLLQHGATPNVAAPGGFSPLHVAAESGSRRMTDMLLASGADASAQTAEGQTPAAIAAMWGHRDLAEVLLRNAQAKIGHDGNNVTVEDLIAEAEARAAETRQRQEASAASNGNSTENVPQPEELDEVKAEQHKKQGNNAFVAGDFEVALAEYRTALRHASPSSQLWANAAVASLRLSKYEDALRDARIARSLDGKNVKAWYREGQAAERLELWEDAAAAYFEAHLVCPEGSGGLDFGALVKMAAEKGRAQVLAAASRKQ